jgi:hypothetical protein
MATDPAHDFDFLHGSWKVRHRRLAVRGAGRSEWLEFAGTADTRPLNGGISNAEEHRIDGADFGGVAIRSFNRRANHWSIWWIAASDGILQPPVHGRFADRVGRFEGQDVDAGRPVISRFLWHMITPLSARWEQRFSYDSGSSWELNWIMDFERDGDGS